MRFKEGDTVIYVRHCDEPQYVEEDAEAFTIGKEYVIREVFEDYYDFEGCARGVWDTQVEGKIRNTALARKMYPKHNIIDEDWLYTGGTGV